MTTADWTQIKIDGAFLDFSEYDEGDNTVYHFTVDGVSYDLYFDVYQTCCESCILARTPDIPFSDLNNINRLDITYSEISDYPDVKNAFVINFYNNSDIVYKITFSNSHNGHYPHSIKVLRRLPKRIKQLWFHSSV